MNSCWKNARNIFYIFLGSICFLLTAVPVGAVGNNAVLDVRVGKGFGRLVFSFDQLPEYSSRSISTVFVLKFKKPVAVDLSAVAGKLSSMITIARRDPDGRGLRFAMSRDYKVNVTKAGNHLIIDFLSKGWRGRPPDVPRDIIDKLAKEAAKARRVAAERARQEAAQINPLRVDVFDARQPTFNRISFNWNRFVTAKLSRKGNMVSVLFGGKATPDLARLKINPPKNLVSIHHVFEKDKLRIVMQVVKGTRVRAFREGPDYIVDLTIAEPSQLTETEKKLYAAMQEKGAKGRIERSEEVTLPAPAPNLRKTVRPSKTAPPLPARSRTRVRSSKKPVKSVAKVTVKKLDLSEADLQSEHKSGVPDTAPRQPAGKPVDLLPKQPVQPKTQARGTFNPLVTKSHSPPKAANSEIKTAQRTSLDNKIRVKRNENSVQLLFPFEKDKVAAAIFQRDEKLWILIDSPRQMDLSGLSAQLGGIVNTIRHEKLEKSQLIEFQLSGPWLSSVSQHGSRWKISIGDLVTGGSKKFTPVKQINGAGVEEVFIATTKKGRLHQIKDKDSGDDLLVITRPGPARSIKKVHEHVEFQLFRTIHGIVVRPMTDDLVISQNSEGVKILGQNGLYLSGSLPKAETKKVKPHNKRRKEARNLNFNSPHGTDIGKFIKRTLELENIIVARSGRARRRARLELTRLWLSRGFAPEALAMLEIVGTENSDIIKDPVFRLMRGMANVMLRRYKKAQVDLESHDLENNPHASLWRGFSAWKQKGFARALARMKRGEPAINTYLPRRQASFRLAGADIAIENGDAILAGSHLDAMPKTGSTALQIAMSRFLEGRLMELQKRPQEAIELYADATRANIRPVTAKAVFYLTDLRLRIGDLKSAAGVNILERLSIVWRGDETELQVLHRLADLYLEKGRYHDAFSLMKTAVQAYPEAKLALALQDRMKGRFEELFLQGKADSLPPIKALALFYDHKYLTPPGRLGDEMIRRLADRLISVDLLDKAASLLEHQVSRRLKGAGRAQVAIRLAMIHLLQHRPKRALKTIYRTRQPRLPAQVRQARRLLEARAYAELGRSGPALELLADDQSEEAGEIKSLALWNGQKWSGAGEQYEKILGDSWSQKEALSSKSRLHVLRAAISYTLGSDRLGVERLRENYAEKMAGGSDAEAFAMITDPLRTSATAVDRLARDIADIDTLEAFVKAFRQRLEQSGGPQTTSAARQSD